jgi:predicted choloylglycine hydrolase
VGEVALTFEAVSEPLPGPRFQTRFEAAWPAYRRWFLRDGDAARPSYPVVRRMLREHMPELVPTWERLVELAGGGDLAARMLALYDPPPLVSGCSQAVLGGASPVLVRNYDFFPDRLEPVVWHSALTGRRVIGMTDCLWGLLDGLNDAGLAVSLAFGGRRATGAGFAISLVLRHVLETCATVGDAVRLLGRVPVQGAYNVTLLDHSGEAATVCVSADEPAAIGQTAVATNHQSAVEWPEHARATASVEREARLLELLADPGLAEERFVAAFLAPPLYNTDYAAGLGTLYTAVHRPADGSVEYRWPGMRWRQSFGAFEEGTRVVPLYAARGAAANVAV